MKPAKGGPFRFLLRMIQGALVGTGAILPGISGGVLCVAFGIYEPIMEFLSHPFRSFRKNMRLLLPVVLGGLIGFVLLARVVEAFLAASAAIAMSLFCGLICGTIPSLMKKSVASDQQKGWSCFIITLVASFALFQILDSQVVGGIQPNGWWYLFCGVVWGFSMVVPGLSSSSILLFMGLYQPMAEGIGNLDFAVLLPLGAGFLITLAVTARIINSFLQNHYAVMSRIILGFVISSVLMIVPVSFAGAAELAAAVLCFAAGFAISLCMELKRPQED